MNSHRIIMPRTAQDFVQRLCQGAGMNADDSRILADICVETDCMGVESHGIARIPLYARRIKSGVMVTGLTLEVIHEYPWGLVADAHDAMGHLAAYRVMEKVMDKAAALGIGVGVVRGSNHYGMASYYSLMAARKDMIGISMSNATPIMAPFGGMEAKMGNNPIAIAVPGHDAPISLDVSCSQVARGRISKAERENKPIPPGCALDNLGRPTTDAVEALKGVILPFAGHKGYGFAFIADLLTGALAGGNFSTEAPRSDDYSRPRNTCHFFMAINIAMLRDLGEFKDSVGRYTAQLKATRLAEGFTAIKAPGEIEAELRAERHANGIPYHVSTISMLNELAVELGVAPLNV